MSESSTNKEREGTLIHSYNPPRKPEKPNKDNSDKEKKK